MVEEAKNVEIGQNDKAEVDVYTQILGHELEGPNLVTQCEAYEEMLMKEAQLQQPQVKAATPCGQKRTLQVASISAEEVELLSTGCISKPPLPVYKVQELELRTGVREGAYFVELMRRRLHSISLAQSKWLSRVCNHKVKAYVGVQNNLQTFVENVIMQFDAIYGPAEPSMFNAPMRKHRRSAKGQAAAGSEEEIASGNI